MVFKDMKSLNAYLQKQIAETLKKEVAEVVKDEMVEQVDKVVYSQYTPYNLDGGDHHYHRTYQLKNKDNMESTMPNDSTLEVENVREGAETVVTGKGYEWGKNSGYVRDLDKEIGARDFIQATRDEMSRKKSHIQALKEGLKKKGFKVE